MPSEFCALLIDDDTGVHAAVGALLKRAGWAFRSAVNPAQAHAVLAAEPIDAILLDLNFARGQTDGEEGFAALSRILGDDPDAAVVVITGHSGIRTAVAAMRAGAHDFVMKPWRNEDLLARIEAAAVERRRRAEAAMLRGQARETQVPYLVGESPAIANVRAMVRRVGPTRADVLICGPSGCGKALVAAVLHSVAGAADLPLAVFDVRRLPNATESFRDAISGRSAVLLRYVDTLDAVTQSYLLELLPDHLRVFASAQNGAALIPALLARVGTIEVQLPALDTRGNDAVLLANHFLQLAMRKHARPGLSLSAQAVEALKTMVWPDNLRGLARTIERAVVLAEGTSVDIADFRDFSDTTLSPALIRAAAPTLDLAERRLVTGALQRHGFNVSKAAHELGVSRAALYRRIAKFGL